MGIPASGRRGADTPLAVFDLDGTLVARDTFLPFLVSYALRRLGRRAWPALATLPVEVGLYAGRLRSADAAKGRLLRAFLGVEPESRIAAHAAWFAEHRVGRWLRPEVVGRLREHQAAGHRVILLSASRDVYVREVGRTLGIDEVICTRVAAADGHCRGHLAGPNCKGEAKVALMREATGLERAPSDSFAYGDSRSDLPILRWVDHGHLVRPLRPWMRRPVRLHPVDR